MTAPQGSSTFLDKPRWRVAQVAAVVGSVIVSLAFALSPEDKALTSIVWKPQTEKDSGALILSRGWPQSLTFSAQCSDLVGRGAFEVLDTGGLVLTVSDSGSLTLKTARASGTMVVSPSVELLPSQRRKLSIQLKGQHCTLFGGFNSLNSAIWLKLDGTHIQRGVPEDAYPSVERLESGNSGQPRVTEVEILTRPVGVQQTTIRQALGVGSLLMLVLALLVFLHQGLRPTFRDRIKSVWLKLPRPRPVDAVLATVLSVVAVLHPSFLDDGWVWARVDNASRSGIFSNIFTAQDAWLPQGFLQETALKFLVSQGASLLAIRLGIVVLLVAAWVILRTAVVEPMVSRSSAVSWISAAGFLGASGALLITLRPEPWVVLWVACTWAALGLFLRTRTRGALLMGLTTGGLAILTHQSGLVALGPMVVLLSSAMSAARMSQLSAQDIVLAVLLAGSVSLTILVLPFSLPTVLESLQAFSVSPEHQSIFNEYGRVYDVIVKASPPVLFIVLASAISTLTLFGWLFYGEGRERQRPLLVAVALSWGGLLLTSSKWQFHLGALTPAIAVLFSLIAYALLRKEGTPQERRAPVLFSAGLLFVGMFAVSNPGSTFGAHSFGNLSWTSFSETIGPAGALKWWLLGFVCLLGVALTLNRLPRKRWQGLVAALVVLATILPLGLSLGWIVTDTSAKGQWTLAYQNYQTLRHRQQCGTLDGGTKLFKGQPRPLINRGRSGDEVYGIPLQADAVPRYGRKRDRPFPKLPVWGSFDLRSTSGKSKPTATNRFSSPMFRLGNEREISLWTKSGSDYSGIRGEVVFVSEAGRRIAALSLDKPISAMWAGYDASVWILHSFEVPEGAASVYGAVSVAQPSEGQWIALSTPIATTDADPMSVLRTGRAYVGPFELLHVPCVQAALPADGYWPQAKFLIRDEFSATYTPLPLDVGKTSLGCSAYGRTCVERLWYRNARVKTEAVSENPS